VSRFTDYAATHRWIDLVLGVGRRDVPERSREPLCVRQERVSRLLDQAEAAIESGGRGTDITNLPTEEFQRLMRRSARRG
jgi:hypothetical protein